MAGAHFYGLARIFVAGRAFLSPGRAFLESKFVFKGRVRIFMAGRAFLWPGRAFLQPGSTAQADEATGSVVGGPPKRFGKAAIVPLDAVRWHRPRPPNPGTRLDTRSFFF